MMLWCLGYVVLFAEDLEGLVKFYTETVGLPVRLRAEGYAELAVEGARFALLSRTRVAAHVGDAQAGRPASGTHEGLVTVLVEDVDRVHRELAGRGVAFLGTPQDRPWGQRTVCFQDPEGHIVELATNRPRPERTGI
jgi:catechol 2,3-dioxygenase-like lactoylglutathione lyase family enzyme